MVGTGRESIPTMFFVFLAMDSSTVAEHLPHHPKVNGQATASVTGW